jgi:chromosome segregation ATPase
LFVERQPNFNMAAQLAQKWQIISSEHFALKEKVKGFEDMVVALVEEKLELKKMLDEKEEELSKVKNSLKSIQNMEISSTEILKENQNLKNERVSDTEKIHKLLEINEKLTERLKEKEVDLSSLKFKAEDTQSENDKLHKIIRSIKSAKTQLEQQAMNLASKNAELEMTLINVQAKHDLGKSSAVSEKRVSVGSKKSTEKEKVKYPENPWN